jgi:hypothetical protein
MIMTKNVICLCAAAMLLTWACKKEEIKSYTCTGSVPTYTGSIKQIMDTDCATSGCHNASSKRDGIDLSTYALVKSEGGKDRFLGSIQHLSGYKAMPEGKALLPDSTIQKIYCWVNNGTPE